MAPAASRFTSPEPDDGGAGLAILLELTGVQLDVAPVGVEQAQLAVGARS
jgi:hypothetical protein